MRRFSGAARRRSVGEAEFPATHRTPHALLDAGKQNVEGEGGGHGAEENAPSKKLVPETGALWKEEEGDDEREAWSRLLARAAGRTHLLETKEHAANGRAKGRADAGSGATRDKVLGLEGCQCQARVSIDRVDVVGLAWATRGDDNSMGRDAGQADKGLRCRKGRTNGVNKKSDSNALVFRRRCGIGGRAAC